MATLALRNTSIYSPLENDYEGDDNHENGSMVNARASSAYYRRRDSKLITADQKVMRAVSMINDALDSDPIKRFRERSSFSEFKWIIYPDDTFKIIWDVLVVMVMFYTITVIPYRIAFPSKDTQFWRVFDLIVDCFFMIDIIINCFTAFYKTQDMIETSNKEIFLNYFKTWMVFDILASIPFQEIFKEESWNSMIKFGRLPRLYRLIKIAKIIRVIKNQGFSNFSERFGISFLKIPLSLKRMLYFLSVFFLVCHLISCLWFFISTIEISKNRNWVIKYGVQDLDEFDLYICSLYWTVTTLTTVGYGDITPDNNLERGVCMCVMIGGVFFYSYTVGTITSLMSESDRRRAKFESKLHILNDIQKTFQIKNNLYKKIKAAILFDQSRLNKERDEIIESLPRKLSLQLKFIINQNLVKDNHFFDGKPIRFINVILSHLKPFKFNNREFIFYQGQYSGEMYFLTKGKLNLVKTQNKEMITIGTIEEGDYYGDVEIILSITHDFGGRAGRDTELMALGREDLFMKVLSNCEESFKDKIIDEADKRRKKFTEMMQEAVTNHNITKNIARSVNNHERHPSSAGSDSLFRNNSKTNERRIRKIRNTLSKKTISMLESTAGDYQLDAMKKKLSSVELFVGKLEERVVLYLKKQGKSDLEIFEILGCCKVTGSDVGEHSSAIDDDFKLKISRFSNQKNRGVGGSEPPEGRPVIIQTFLENNAVESFSNIQNLSKDKDLFIFSNIERQKIRTMTEMRKDEDKDIVQNISVKEFKIPEDKDENINEIILELEKRVDGDDENQSKSEVSLSFVRSNEKSK